jgi:hypothetical protein
MNTLRYFVGKICTISTVQINYRFKEEQMMDYFMGFIEEIDDTWIWLTHPQTKCKSCIAIQYLVAIAEEQVLYENKPEDAKIIEEYRKEKPISAAKTAIPKSTFVNPIHLAELAKKAKENFK